ncbi:hypothetical protein L1994_01430 [Methanomicrobium antiquum]|uniref:DUF3821 domain-containing protein n=1 Tax=Methanomicrobium antiquum TaxID=487686 RepID=A0AAF0FSF6_9EURY|nr:hypothetical protein [Methanomicrobium antiquum]WFN37086.1 hypothetical protein L1994_01430 [Methanomicrobium antiquum]
MALSVYKEPKYYSEIHLQIIQTIKKYYINKDNKKPVFKKSCSLQIIAIAVLILFIFSASPVLAGNASENSDYFAKERYVSPSFDMDLELSPVSIYGGTLAKDQPLYLSGTGAPDSEIGVWFYKESMGVVDKNRFVKFQTDENGDILGDGVILDKTKSHKLFSGKYYTYIVGGDSEFINSGYFPDTNTEFEIELAKKEAKNPYMKIMLLAEVPWIRFDTKTFPDITTGTSLKLSGTTNLGENTRLIISIEPTAPDEPFFKDQIIEDTKVESGGDYYAWKKEIFTDELAPGEYLITVEAADADASAFNTFSVYDEAYSANTADDSLLVKSYMVDDETKSLLEDAGSQEEDTIKTDVSAPVNQSPPSTGLLILETALITGVLGFAIKKRENKK